MVDHIIWVSEMNDNNVIIDGREELGIFCHKTSTLLVK